MSRTATGIYAILETSTTSVHFGLPKPLLSTSLCPTRISISVKATRCSGTLWLVRLGGLAGRPPMPPDPSQPRPSGMLRLSSPLVWNLDRIRSIGLSAAADNLFRWKEGLNRRSGFRFKLRWVDRVLTSNSWFGAHSGLREGRLDSPQVCLALPITQRNNHMLIEFLDRYCYHEYDSLDRQRRTHTREQLLTSSQKAHDRR